MKVEEKHDVGNTIYTLRHICLELSKIDDPKIPSVILAIETCAKRLEKSRKGKTCDKVVAAFGHYSDIELLTMLIIGEAEGEPWESRVGVALTTRNRVLVRKSYFGRGWRGVMLHPLQFSCFTENSAIRRMLTHKRTSSHIWDECWKIAFATYFGLIADFVGDPLYYHSASIEKPKAWKWAHPLERIGNLIFYTDSKLVPIRNLHGAKQFKLPR